MTQTTPENAAWKEFLLSTRSGDLVRYPPRYPKPLRPVAAEDTCRAATLTLTL